MSPIDLRLSLAARDALARCITEMEFDDPITCVSWHESETRTDREGKVHLLPGNWGVGWYAGDQVPLEWIQTIDGIKFTFGQRGYKSEELNGGLLDFRDGQFFIYANESRI